jgi:hypothetical protein
MAHPFLSLDLGGGNLSADMMWKGGRVAQLVEQCPFKAWVAGSNPAALTIFQPFRIRVANRFQRPPRRLLPLW